MITIGIMQGRLLPPVDNKIQAFPKTGWQKEFALAKKLGLDCIEFIFDGENYPCHPLMNDEGIRDIRKLERENNIQIFTVCADYFMVHPIHRGLLKEKEQAVQILQTLIRNCSRLDIQDIVVPCVDSSRLRNSEETRDFMDHLTACLSVAEDCGIRLALETDLGPESFAALMTEIGHPQLTINYDTGNSASLGYDPDREFSMYSRWISDIHIKDRLFQGTTVPLGEGSVDFSKIFHHIDSMNYRGPLIFQTARKQPGRESETIKGYLDFISKYLH